MSNVMINIASEFDSKGFKKAETSTSALEKQAKKLGKTLLAAFSVQKITQYSKASILAYSQDQKAAALLSNQLKNLGLAYQAVDVEKFIAQLEAQTGILDDELRPAFSRLARVTGTVAESQKLMTLAFDVSRGAGIDYMQAVDAISKAYVGNLKGLKKLNLGLTDAQLKTMKFEDIVTLLNKQFKGAGAASVNTYSGKIDRLNVSLANAQETIGKGFVDAFTLIAEDGDFKNVISSIDNMATNVADTLVGIGAILDQVRNKFNSMPSWVKYLFRKVNETSLFSIITGALQSEGSKARVKQSMPQGAALFLEEQRGKAAAKTLGINKKITQEIKKQTADKKAQLAIDKANQMLNTAKGVFDLEQVSVAAAMANTTLTENERKRLEIKQAIFALEAAIDSGDQKRIESGTKILGGLLTQFSALQAQDTLLGKIQSAYDALGMNKDLINLSNLDAALAKLIEMLALMDSLTKTQKTAAFVNAISTATTRPAMNTAVNVAAAAGIDAGAIGNALATGLINMGVSTPTALTISRYTGQAIDWWNKQNMAMNTATNPTITGNVAPTVNVTVTDNANKLVDVIMDTVTNQSANGNLPYIVRNGQQLAW